MNESWDAYLASPVDFFAGSDDIINLAKERELGIEIIELWLLVVHIGVEIVWNNVDSVNEWILGLLLL